MKTTTIAVMAWLVATMAISATEIGGTVERVINVNQRIDITPELPTAVMSVDLDAGTWIVEASLNCFFRGRNGATIFAAGAISRYTPNIGYQDGRTAFIGVEIVNGRADPIVPSVGRAIQISAPTGTTRPVYLMLWIHETAADLTNAQAYGFMEARKIRDNQ